MDAESTVSSISQEGIAASPLEGGANNLLGLSSFLMDLSSVLRTALTHPAGAATATYMLTNKMSGNYDVQARAGIQRLETEKKEIELSRKKIEQAGKYNDEIKKAFDMHVATLNQEERLLTAERSRFDAVRKIGGAAQIVGFSIAQMGENMEIAGAKYMRSFNAGAMPGLGGAGAPLSTQATKFAYATEKWLAGVQSQYGSEVSEKTRVMYQNFGQYLMKSGKGSTEDVQKTLTNLAIGESVFGIGGDLFQTLTKGRGYENISPEAKAAYINRITEQYQKGAYGVLTGPEASQTMNAMLAATAGAGLGGRERMETSYRYMSLLGKSDLPAQSMLGIMKFISPFVSNMQGMTTFQALTGRGPGGAMDAFKNDPSSFISAISQMTSKYIANPRSIGYKEQSFLNSFFGGNREELINFSEAVSKLSTKLKDAKTSADKFSLTEFDKLGTLGAVNKAATLQGSAADQMPTLLEKATGWLKQKVALPVAEQFGTNTGYAIGALGTIASIALAYSRMRSGKSAGSVLTTLVGGQILSDLTKNIMQSGDVSGAGGLSTQPGGVSQGIDPMMALLLMQNLKGGGATAGGGGWKRASEYITGLNGRRIAGGIFAGIDAYKLAAGMYSGNMTGVDMVGKGLDIASDVAIMSRNPWAAGAGAAWKAGRFVTDLMDENLSSSYAAEMKGKNIGMLQNIIGKDTDYMSRFNVVPGKGVSMKIGNSWHYINERDWAGKKWSPTRSLYEEAAGEKAAAQNALNDLQHGVGDAKDTGRTSNLGINIVMRNGFGGVMDQANLTMNAGESAKQATLFMNVMGITGLT